MQGGEYERGFPPLIWGSGGYPRGKNWEIVVPENRFLACFRSKCQVSNLILKAGLTYFMRYFASILVYTGAIAGIQRKTKGNDQDLRGGIKKF